jgi:2-polyprenyl-3-methyl-5-hydroxy-6-metoxy-1,4-benzoquinol methylase
MKPSENFDEWPAEGLEHVPACPICRCEERTLAHRDLTDVTFFAAPGLWSLWRCQRCGSGWLDPRPDEASIGRAYQNYYTHAPAKSIIGSSWRHRLGNGYRNWRFGANLRPASRLGPLAALFTPNLRRVVDGNCRYLPRSVRGRNRLLDYGCGNGLFLQFAGEAGWDCYGIEPDKSARSVACSIGADVRVSLSDFTRGEMFHAVTMSHVIEHVHRPVDLIRQLSDRLIGGGFLYIQTPNMDAIGHQIYGRNWRGLEAPRHLALFTPAKLAEVVLATGFHKLRFHSCPGALEFTDSQSRQIARGRGPNQLAAPILSHRIDRGVRAAALFGPNAEFITLTARKT